MSDHVEVERKFEVTGDAPVPDLAGLPGVAQLRRRQFTLTATYFDVPDFRLLTAGVTLRRRTGGSDAGWHLKLPGGDHARLEVRAPLGRARTVPAPLRNRARALIRAQTPQPVALLHTDRTVLELLDDAGAVLAEFSDDRVSAQAPPDGTSHPSTWREWEFELGQGGRTLLDAAAALLVGAGGVEPERGSKVARALGRPIGRPATRGTGAASVIAGYLAQQVDAIVAGDPAVRVDAPDSVHQMRVATRRLRSVLATFRPWYDRQVIDPIRAELKWLGQLLGAARDDEVQRENFAALLAREPDELRLGGIAAWVNREFAGQLGADRTALLAALDGTRYFALLDALDALLTDPPLTAAGRKKGGKALRARVRHDFRRAAALVTRSAPAGADRDLQLHEVRKACKRLRYGAEALSSGSGARMVAVVDAAKNVQEILGDHQDTVVARELLRGMAGRAFLDGQNTFTLGRLHAFEYVRADAAEKAFGPAWKAVRRAVDAV